MRTHTTIHSDHVTRAARRRTAPGPVKARTLLALLVALGAGATASPAVASAAAAVAPPAKAVAQPDPAAGAASSRLDADAVAALAQQRGIGRAEARTQLARERALDERGDRIEASLAGRSGGSFLDAAGNLVVTTLDAKGTATVRQDGVRAIRVDDSSARLAAIKAQLDRHASNVGVGAVQGWFVDVPSNTVVVTVTEGAIDPKTTAMKRLATSFGDSVRIEHKPAAQAPKPADALAGGFQYNTPGGGACSLGFNTVDAWNRNAILTAGHCLTSRGTMTRNGYIIGATRTVNYPTDDFGSFWNSYPSYWRPSPSVYKYNGTYARLAGIWNAPPVGTTVCKSGRTTGFTCGRITALNQTVSYGPGLIIGGLTRHNACVEPGDSGGSNIGANNYALGVTSGASLVNKRYCLARYGQANVSWYQPIGEALTRSGLRLLL